MDPAACLRSALEAFNDERFEDANEHLENYFNWRNRGGAEPAWISPKLQTCALSGDDLADVIEAALEYARTL
jgi:hypothetical protein